MSELKQNKQKILKVKDIFNSDTFRKMMKCQKYLKPNLT